MKRFIKLTDVINVVYCTEAEYPPLDSYISDYPTIEWDEEEFSPDLNTKVEEIRNWAVKYISGIITELRLHDVYPETGDIYVYRIDENKEIAISIEDIILVSNSLGNKSIRVNISIKEVYPDEVSDFHKKIVVQQKKTL